MQAQLWMSTMYCYGTFGSCDDAVPPIFFMSVLLLLNRHSHQHPRTARRHSSEKSAGKIRDAAVRLHERKLWYDCNTMARQTRSPHDTSDRMFTTLVKSREPSRQKIARIEYDLQDAFPVTLSYNNIIDLDRLSQETDKL